MRAGSFLLTPEAGVPLDRQTGAYWMRRAADNGEALARDILRRHPELMVAYPPVPDGPASAATHRAGRD
jgi:TPR repeat protein